MPYADISELPPNVRNVLPAHAQEIFLAAFNHAYEEYQDPARRRHPEEKVEDVCRKVAWSAVKAKYHKGADGNWQENC